MEPQIQRWSAKRKVELLLSLIKSLRKLVDVCREHDLKQSEVKAWRETFVRAWVGLNSERNGVMYQYSADSHGINSAPYLRGSVYSRLRAALPGAPLDSSHPRQQSRCQVGSASSPAGPS